MNKKIGEKYVNKMYAGTEAIMDITDTTATASQVLANNTVGGAANYFYLADGSRVQGSCTYDANTSDATATASEILATKTAYVDGNKVTGTMPNNGQATKSINATTDGASIALANGYYANGSTIAVSGLTAAEIKKDVVYFGVTGTYDPQMPTEHGSATVLYASAKVYEPTSGNLFDQFTVFGFEDILTTEENPQGGITYTIAYSPNP